MFFGVLELIRDVSLHRRRLAAGTMLQVLDASDIWVPIWTLSNYCVGPP